MATELSTALATTTYEIRDKLSEVMPGLFLSNGLIAQDLPALRAKRISHILNLAPLEVPTTAEFYAADHIDFKAISAKDEFDYDMMQHWSESREYLDRALKQDRGRVLVHCQAGINRSGAIAVAYMMVTRRRMLIEAAKSVKRKRYQLITNSNFQLSLVKFATSENLLGKPAPPRRRLSPTPYSAASVPTDEFAATRWPFGGKGKPAVLFLHGTFAPVHKGHLAALDSSLEFIRSQLPELQLAGAFFSPCHQVDALSRMTPDEVVSLEDRLGMLRLACPQAAALADIPVGVDTWECTQIAPPPLSTSVRSFARRATAAAIRRGVDSLPVVVWVVGASGLHWDTATDGMDVDPSLVAVCVMVDEGQEEERQALHRELKDGPLRDKVLWVHARGPSYSSQRVREGSLPVGIPPVEKYAKEHLLWNTPSAEEMRLAALIHQGLLREGLVGWGEEKAMAAIQEDDATEARVEEVGNIWACPLEQPRVWRCFYKPPPRPLCTPAETPRSLFNLSSSSLADMDSESESGPSQAPCLHQPTRGQPQGVPPLPPSQGTVEPPPRLPSPVPVFSPGPLTPSLSDFPSAASLAARLTAQDSRPVRRLVVKVFSAEEWEELRVEEEAYRRLEFVRLQHVAALALPSLVGVARHPHRREGALILEDAVAQGWEMVGDPEGSALYGPVKEDSPLSSPSALPGKPVFPASPATLSSTSLGPLSGSCLVSASAVEKVLKAVVALAWLHAKHWGILGRAAGDGVVDAWVRPGGLKVLRGSSYSTLSTESSQDGGKEGGEEARGESLEELDGLPFLWAGEHVRRRRRRLCDAWERLRKRAGLSLSQDATARLERLVEEPGLLEALYRPALTKDEAVPQGLPGWVETNEDDAVAVRRVGTLTVLHGAFTWDKLGFSMHANEGVLAVGWEQACVGPGPWDLALLLATARRDGEESEFKGPGKREDQNGDDAEMTALSLYHQILMEGGVEQYDFERLLFEYQRAKAGLAPELLSTIARHLDEEDGVKGKKIGDTAHDAYRMSLRNALEASLDLLEG